MRKKDLCDNVFETVPNCFRYWCCTFFWGIKENDPDIDCCCGIYEADLDTIKEAEKKGYCCCLCEACCATPIKNIAEVVCAEPNEPPQPQSMLKNYK